MLKLLLFGIVFATSYIVTGGMRIYAFNKGLVDVPGPRSSHSIPTPHGGGLAIAVTVLGAIAVEFFSHAMPLTLFMALFWGGLAVAAIGFWDDHVPVATSVRIIAHFAAASWAIYWLGGFPPLPVGDFFWDLGWAGHLVGVVAIVWLLNLYNFMDGIDGIAAVEAITVAGAVYLIILAGKPNESSLWLGLIVVATLGFLPWNWPPARIFMGDVGSGFLGFVLAVLAIYTAHQGALTIWTWTILLGVFIADATVTLLRRTISRQQWYLAHRSHAYQHAAIRWSSHRRVTLAVLAINIVWLAPLAWFVNQRPQSGLVVTGVALIPLVIMALMLDAGRRT
jgi:Fuc2NAc and GlcNAc transferase